MNFLTDMAGIKTLQVRITHITRKRMYVMTSEMVLRTEFSDIKKRAEIDAAMQIFQIGYTVIKFEWETAMFGEQELWATFGKMET